MFSRINRFFCAVLPSVTKMTGLGFAVSCALVVPLCAHALEPGAEVRGTKMMVVTAHPLATEAGIDILNRGGSATDAAIAIQAVLGLVEPQSSGFGGGAVMLHWDPANLMLEALDGRETAPAEATDTLFLDDDGQPMAFFDAATGGRAVGTPGTLRLLELAHQRHGRLPWPSLFSRAIELAESGFPVSERLHHVIEQADGLFQDREARWYFFNYDGSALRPGQIRTNRPYAQLLRDIAAHGAKAFYQGPVASAIVEAVRNHPFNPGVLATEDFTDYRAHVRSALCAPYRDWQVCGIGLPSAGQITLSQMLGILERFNMAKEPPGPQTDHLIAEAARLAYADRDKYVADGDFVHVPVKGLMDRAYLAQRARLIDRNNSMGEATAGRPPGTSGWQFAALSPNEEFGTSHFSIVDPQGNIVSYSGSIEMPFGSRIMVNGIMLNNQLTDFSFLPEIDGRLVANRLEPGKRPRSSMAPTIVFDQSARPALVTGSPGGGRIVNYVAQNIIAMLDWGMSPAQAIALPHVVNRNGTTEIEDRPEGQERAEILSALGHDIAMRPLTSGLNMILFNRGRQLGTDSMIGSADPRREGTAAGQ